MSSIGGEEQHSEMNSTVYALPRMFHGTLSDIDSFCELTHFGTRNAAFAAASAKYFDQDDEAATGWAYEVQPIVQCGDIVKMEDWGSPRKMALLSAMSRSVDFGIPWSVVSKILNEINKNGDKDYGERLAFAAIRNAVVQSNKKAILYTNDAEDSGSISMLTLATEPQVLLRISKTALSTADLKHHYNLISKERRLTLRWSLDNQNGGRIFINKSRPLN